MRFPIAPPLAIFGLLAAAAVVVNSAEDNVGTSPAAAVVDSRVCSADDGGGCASSPDDPKDDVAIPSAASTPTPACIDVDVDDKCAYYAAENACADNPGYMAHKCAATCDACDGPSAEDAVVISALASANGGGDGGPCGDDNYQCSEWAGMGECDANPK